MDKPIKIGIGVAGAVFAVGLAVVLVVTRGDGSHAGPTSAAPSASSTPSGWRKIIRPGDQIPKEQRVASDTMPDTEGSRAAYLAQVMTKAPGEPPLNRKAAEALMAQTKAAIAKRARIPETKIEVKISEGGATIIVAPGVRGRFPDEHGEPPAPPDDTESVCEDTMLLAPFVEIGDGGITVFADVGIGGLVCKSDGCMTIWDMRQGNSASGFSIGTACSGQFKVGNSRLPAPEWPTK